MAPITMELVVGCQPALSGAPMEIALRQPPPYTLVSAGAAEGGFVERPPD
ncbi:MAG: hypothetical protein M3541_02570 [Acidobacteriota bacterium]|nr:hypothetical protein [Acidobacteriota bacterium]